MTQSALTIIAQIAGDARVAAQHLHQLGGGAAQLLQLPQALLDAKRIHFLSFFVFESDTGASFVALEVNGDGSARTLRTLLAGAAPHLLQQVFQHCHDVPAQPTPKAWRRFLRKHDAAADAFYLANPGRTVAQIETAVPLRKLATAELVAAQRELDAVSLWKRVRTRVAGPLQQARSPQLLPFRVRWGLHPKGAPAQLRALSRWLARLAVLLVPLGWYGAYRALGSPPSVQRVLLAAGLALALALAMLPIWLRERPIHAKGSSRRRAWLSYLRAWLWVTLGVAAAVGLIALGRPAAERLPALLTAYLDPVLRGALASAGGLTIVIACIFAYLAAGRALAIASALAAVVLWTLAVSALWNTPQQLLQLWALATLATILLIALYAVVFLTLVRTRERDDQEMNIEYDLAQLKRTTAREDQRLQNHLATVTELRPGRFRVYALRVVLRAVSLLAKLYFNQGDLDRITSIHFARFVIHSHAGAHRLLFMGNYDGGFASYLGAFSIVNGTTAVWSCTQGFPRSFGLIEDGARDEQRFKAFGRRSQVETLGWFSAYPALSTRDVHDSTATHLDLHRLPAQPGSNAWLRLLQALVSGRRAVIAAELRGPFDEVACDAAVRRL
ncbi:MAG TPA: hypothetical protein VJR89_11335 [Polyangiales bacterium]|nr:hypothetical protein [Polyangiales bacterium]